MKIREKKVQDISDPILMKREPPLPEAAALCVTTVVLILFGLAVLYSTSFGVKDAAFFLKQLKWGIVGAIGFFAVLFIGYKKITDFSPYLWIGMFFLLILPLFMPPIKGARRWIPVFGLGNIQPSEFAKVIVSLFMAKICSDNIKMVELNPLKFHIKVLICTMPCIMLVFIGKDLGTTLLLTVIVFAVMYAAGVKLRYLLPYPVIGIPLLYVYIKLFSPYRWERLLVFKNLEALKDSSGYQVYLSLLALGSGSWTGVGFAESRLKHKYLPEAHTDFILSIVGEELGFVWICVLIVAYATFVTLAISISTRARTRQGMLLSFALTTFIAVQAIINVGVISAAFPTKGMPAPFISYGGSSLVSCMVAAGLILSVAYDAAYPEYYEPLHARTREFFRKFRRKKKDGSI